MAQMWFLSRGERVYGPWSTEEVARHRRQGNIGDADVIWGEGRAHWVALARWSPRATTEAAERPAPRDEVASPRIVAAPSEVETIVQVVTTRPDPDDLTRSDLEVTAVTAVTAVRDADAMTDDPWHYAVDGASFGPFSRSALIIELRRRPSIDGISLWTKGMREWASMAEFHDVMNELDVNRRSHPRASATGVAELAYEGLKQSAPVISISEGGVRVFCDSQLRAGQIIALDLRIDGIAKAITARAEVRYCANGVVGLKFQDLSAGLGATIASYVDAQPADARRVA